MAEAIIAQIPLLLGLSAWAGIFLREERLRALLPMRKKRVDHDAGGAWCPIVAQKDLF